MRFKASFCIFGAAAAVAVASATIPRAAAQNSPTGGAPATTSAPATRPAGDPAAGVESKLARVIEVRVAGRELEKVIAMLREGTSTNVVVNWAALEKAGVTRQTPVFFQAPRIGYEQALRLLLEGLSTEKGRLSFAVTTDGGGLIEISTVEGFAKQQRVDIYEMKRLLEMSFEGGGQDKVGEVTALMSAALQAYGEPEGTWKLGVEAMRGRMVFSGSARAHAIVGQLRLMLMNPVRPGTVGRDAVLGLWAKKTEDRLEDKISVAAREGTLDEWAAAIAEAGKVGVVALPSTEARAKLPAMKAENEKLGTVVASVAAAAGVGWEVSPSGVIVLGREDQLALHDVVCAYDIRELVTRAAKGKGVAGVAEKLVAAVNEKIGAVKSREAVLYQGVLVVRASARQQREVSVGMAGMLR